MIHICFALNDKTGRYSKFTATTILSIFENTTSAVTIHILHDNTLTVDNRDKFIQLAERYEQTLKFYNVEELCKNELDRFLEFNPKFISNVIGIFYRFMIPKVLSPDIEKIIYLDSDIIVNLDINELWQIDLGDKVLAGVPEIFTWKTFASMCKHFSLCRNYVVKCEDYFNSGVLVMDLNFLRREEDTILNGAKFTSQYNAFGGYPDQDILNYCFSKMALKLPAKFNKHIQFIRLEKEKLDRKIYHYSGSGIGIGLGLDMNDEFNRLWMKYFLKTSFLDVEAIGHLYEGFLNIKNNVEKSALKLSIIFSNKPRAFVILEKDIYRVVENFSVKPGEEILAIESSLPLPKLLDLMNASRGEKIFFIMLPGFKFKHLEAACFVRGKDFLDGYDFFLDEKSLNEKVYSLVTTM